VPALFVLAVLGLLKRPAGWRDPIVWLTGVLAVVAGLQWRTLEKTDSTLRAGEQAFIFLEKIDQHQNPVASDNTKTEWNFIPILTNSGTTQAKNLFGKFACQKTFDPAKMQGRTIVIGPRQSQGASACEWSSDQLEAFRQNHLKVFMTGIITYEDVFDASHITRYCQVIEIQSDPRTLGTTLRWLSSICPEYPDCTDKECDQNK
jgi:hypothetical protein